MHDLVIYFDGAVTTDAIFDIHHVRLVEKVMYHGRNQIESAV